MIKLKNKALKQGKIYRKMLIDGCISFKKLKVGYSHRAHQHERTRPNRSMTPGTHGARSTTHKQWHIAQSRYKITAEWIMAKLF